MLDRRVLELPKKGKVVLAHPAYEWPAQQLAASEDLSYFLSPSVRIDSRRVFVVDVGAINKHIEEVAF